MRACIAGSAVKVMAMDDRRKKRAPEPRRTPKTKAVLAPVVRQLTRGRVDLAPKTS